MGGSSAIITAALRALCAYFRVDIPLPVQAKLVLEAETQEIGMPAGPQDRVIQVYEGLVYMDFRRDLMESRGFGEYEPLDPGLLPPIYLAYRTSLSEGTEVFHNNVRERWRQDDPEIVAPWRPGQGMPSRDALPWERTTGTASADRRQFRPSGQMYRIKGNLEMICAARSAGASANFAGSGGAHRRQLPGRGDVRGPEQALKPLAVR